MKPIAYEDILAEAKKNQAFLLEYESLEEEFALMEALIHARSKAKLTQAEVARRMGTTQSVIARLESGKGSPSLKTLKKYADATGVPIVVRLNPKS